MRSTESTVRKKCGTAEVDKDRLKQTHAPAQGAGEVQRHKAEETPEGKNEPVIYSKLGRSTARAGLEDVAG